MTVRIFLMFLKLYWIRILIIGLILLLIALSIIGLASLESFYRHISLAQMPFNILMAGVHASIFVFMYLVFLRGGFAKLERSKNGACIRGLETMDWGGSFFTRQESFMACLVEVLRCAGREAAYAEVMGLSGAAVKLTTGTDNWCPSQAISDVGADCTARAARMFGFERAIIQLDEKENPGGK